MLTQAGSGYSTCDGLDVTRWREDATSDCWGQYFYIRDLDGGGAWSAGRQPLAGDADDYETILGSDRAVFQRRDGDIETRSEIAVAADADAEVRRITLTNHGVLPRTLDVTSYAEVSLNSRRADQAHPAFAKLFLETEYLPAPPTLLCRRRPRARDQKPIWALHFLAGPERADTAVGVVEYETDRARFLGRGRSAACPAALDSGVALSGTVGPVLDPVFSLRRRVRLAPNTSAVLAFGTALAADRNEAVALARRFSDLAEVERTFQQSRTHSQATLVALGISPEDAALFHRLAAHVLFTGPALRSRESVIGNRLGQSGLWPYAISGDLPIVLARFSSPGQSNLASELIRAHAYWRRCGLVADLVLLHDADPADELHEQLEELVRLGPTSEMADKPGGVFLRGAAEMPAADVMLLEAAARAILRGDDGSLAEQLERAPDARHAAGRPARHSRHDDGHSEQVNPCRRGAVVCERVGRVHARRPGVRPDSSRSRAAAGSVEQRPREPWVRLPDHRGRRRLHLGGQRPDESPDAVEQRPGRRPSGRGPLSPRRGDWGVLVTDAGPLRRRRDDRRPSRAGLHALHQDQPRIRSRPPRLRLRYRSGEADSPSGQQPRRSAQTAVSNFLHRVGAGRAPRAGRTECAVHARLGERRPVRPQRLGG